MRTGRSTPPGASPLSLALLRQAANGRTGLLLAPQPVPNEACDVACLCNWAVPADPAEAWQSVSGAVAWRSEAALAGAIAEGLERMAAARVPLPLKTRAELQAGDEAWLDDVDFALFSPEQRAQPGFPWPMHAAPGDGFVRVHHLRFAVPPSSVWVPQELVGLGPRAGEARMPSTSSGLAAHRDGHHGPWLPLLRATQELLERDAFAVTWLHGLGGRELPVPARWLARARALGGTLRAFDLTQAWNPQPVVAMMGGAPCEGRMRWVLGLACRESWAAALEKAGLEWAQSLAFAGFMQREQAHLLPTEALALRRFDEHAAFYSLRPGLWPDLPIWRHAMPVAANHPAHALVQAQAPSGAEDAAQARGLLQHCSEQLAAAGIDLFYRELTTRDVAAAGLRVMRVLSPQLAQLHADERAPFLGGRTADWRWRFPDGRPHGPFPNPMPHPLG